MSRAKRPAAGTAARATRVSNRTPIPSAFVRLSTGTGLRSPRKYSRGNTRGPAVWASGDDTPEPFQEDDSMTASTAVSQLLARWAHLYGHTPGSATVTYLHLVGILVGGGVAVAADRASLRLSPATPDWSQELARLAGVHRWVVAGLALIFASGLLMMFAELHSFATSVLFWTKMGLIALLLGNGYIRMRAETALRQGLAAGWGRFRRTSVASLVLWFVILLAGTLLHSTT